MTEAATRPILVIEDDRTLNLLICDQLSAMGHPTRGVRSRAEALAELAGFAPALAILDIRLPDSDGMTFLSELRDYCPVVILTAYGSIDQAVRAVQAGAVDYLVKPITAEAIELALSRVFETAALKRDLAFWRAHAVQGRKMDLIGPSAAMAELRRVVELVAPTETPVLLQGEGGTGKGVVAATIHAGSQRAQGRFVTVDCDSEMSGAELFGEVSASGLRREGLLATAEGGTIFLNDVDRLPGALQARLFRCMESGRYRVAGAEDDRVTSARWIAATGADLAAAAREQKFSADLYYQLAGMVLTVPPLRARPEDIPALAQELLSRRSFQRGIEKRFAPETLAALTRYEWPGNIRELHNAVERGVILSAGNAEIAPQHMGLGAPRSRAATDAAVSLSFAKAPDLDQLRNAYLRELLALKGGNRAAVAEVLNMSERNTYRLLKKLEEEG